MDWVEVSVMRVKKGVKRCCCCCSCCCVCEWECEAGENVCEMVSGGRRGDGERRWDCGSKEGVRVVRSGRGGGGMVAEGVRIGGGRWEGGSLDGGRGEGIEFVEDMILGRELLLVFGLRDESRMRARLSWPGFVWDDDKEALSHVLARLALARLGSLFSCCETHLMFLKAAP